MNTGTVKMELQSPSIMGGGQSRNKGTLEASW